MQLHDLPRTLPSSATGRVEDEPDAGKWQGHTVAVKVLLSGCQGAELSSFRREVLVLSSLRHEHIICLLAACLAPPNVFLVEELALGGTLYDRLHGHGAATGGLPYREVHAVLVDQPMRYMMCFLRRLLQLLLGGKQAGADMGSWECRFCR